jgi:hypothetical protein
MYISPASSSPNDVMPVIESPPPGASSAVRFVNCAGMPPTSRKDQIVALQ